MDVDQHFGDLPWIKLDRKRFPLQLASGLDKDQKDPRAIHCLKGDSNRNLPNLSCFATVLHLQGVLLILGSLM